MLSVTIKRLVFFKRAVICYDSPLLVENGIICQIKARMKHFNHFKAIKLVSFETQRCLWFKNNFNRFNRTKSLWGPMFSTKPIDIQSIIWCPNFVNVSFTKSNSQPAASRSRLKSDNIFKNKKFTPPFGLLWWRGFWTIDLATQKATNPASVEKFRRLCNLQTFVLGL